MFKELPLSIIYTLADLAANYGLTRVTYRYSEEPELYVMTKANNYDILKVRMKHSTYGEIRYGIPIYKMTPDFLDVSIDIDLRHRVPAYREMYDSYLKSLKQSIADYSMCNTVHMLLKRYMESYTNMGFTCLVDVVSEPDAVDLIITDCVYAWLSSGHDMLNEVSENTRVTVEERLCCYLNGDYE